MKAHSIGLLVLLSLAAVQSAVACVGSRVPDKPVIPSGAQATIDEMEASHVEVSTYIAEVQKRLPCINDDMRYNATVVQMQKTADAFNRELKAFKTSQGFYSAAAN